MPKLKNINWESFCVLFIGKHRGNRTQAYMEAYNGKAKKLSYVAVRQSASQLLTIPHIQNRCRELMDKSGLTAEKLDSKLLFLVDQMEDYKTSMSAIKEGNALLKRTGNTPQIQQNTLTYEQHIHLHSGQRAVQQPIRESETQLSGVPPEILEDQHESVGDNNIPSEHSAGDIRGSVDEPSESGQAYKGLCA